VELKKEKRKSRSQGAVKKTSVGVLIEESVWKQFRICCIENGDAPGNILTNLIRDYLQKQDRR